MKKQEMKTKIERLEQQVLFLISLVTATRLIVTDLQGGQPSEDDLRIATTALKAAKESIGELTIEELLI